ncbi:SMI1/KNR4 family protein [Micromonospora aurantiaca]|uniref:SMI1/KNR4 family protein n=1 Tax=Micromonospora aurantiaca (nom. illeg.) TaxID=47850 RepID=UPI003814D56D
MVFGANGHQWRREPPLTTDELAELESQLDVELPAEYRSFLLQVSRGGAGPAYGLFPVQRVDDRWRWEGDGAELTDLKTLSRPFPHTDAFNPQTTCPIPLARRTSTPKTSSTRLKTHTGSSTKLSSSRPNTPSGCSISVTLAAPTAKPSSSADQLAVRCGATTPPATADSCLCTSPTGARRASRAGTEAGSNGPKSRPSPDEAGTLWSTEGRRSAHVTLVSASGRAVRRTRAGAGPATR